MKKKLAIREIDPSVKELVDKCDGYCPCEIFRTPDTKCMCKTFRDKKEPCICHCGRYEKYYKDLTADLEIESIWIRQHEVCPNGVIGIDWSSAAGFGRYELIMQEDGTIHAYTEHMDSKEDKKFTKAILEKLLEKIVIEE